MSALRPALLALILASATGAARAEDNPACARFKSALEYNDCLAKLGAKAWPSHAWRKSGDGGRPDRAGRKHMELSVAPDE